MTGNSLYTVPASSIGAISINGGSGPVTVTLDYSQGDPIPGGFNFNGQTLSGGEQNELVVVGDAGANYTLGSGQLAINKSGQSDTVNLTNVSSFNLFGSGGTSSIQISSGSFSFNSDLGGGGATVDMTVDSGASVAFGVTQHLDSLNISSGAAVQMLPAGSQILVTNTLTVNGTLDLTNNDLIVNDPANTAAIEEAVALGNPRTVGGSAANISQGTIFSSTGYTDGMVIGVASMNQLGAYPLTNLDGQAVLSTAVVARYTYAGDAYLTGYVSASDFGVVNHYYGTVNTLPLWYEGDFNYDGYTNGADYAFINHNYGDEINSAFPDSSGTLAITGGSTLTVNGADMIVSGEMIVDQGTATLESGLFELTTSSSAHIRNGGVFNIAGGTFTNQITVNIDSGGTLQTAVPLDPGALDVNALGVLSLASGSSLTGGQVTIEPGETLLNAATLNLSNVLSSGTLVLDPGSAVVNSGIIVTSTNLNLGSVNLQNTGTIQTSGVVNGSGTYSPSSTMPYYYSIYGGTVSGTLTESGSDTYSYSYTPTSETYSDNDTDTASYSDTGATSNPSDGGTDTGGVTDSGGSTYSEQCSTSGSLVNGAWVWSGSDSGSSSDHGTSTYSDTGNYVEYVDGFRVAGTTSSSGGSNSTDSSNWSLTLNANGTWTINSDSNSSSGGDHSNYSYAGGDSYSQNVSGVSDSASTTESGSHIDSDTYSDSSNFTNGAWVNAGTSSGTWNNSGNWTENFSTDLGASLSDESVDGGGTESTGEKWTSSGTDGSTLNANGTWALTSGSDTDTDHNFDNGSDQMDLSVSSATADVSLSGDNSYGFTDDTTMNGSVSGGAWVYTGSGSTHSTDSGDESLQAEGSYNRDAILGDVIYSLPVTGAASQTFQGNYSDSFSINSTLAASGTVTTTGSGSSHESSSGDFSFSGGGEDSASFIGTGSTLLTGTLLGNGTEDCDFTESGFEDGTSNVTTTWVLDPNGNWRAANTQDTETGETNTNYKYVCSVNDIMTDSEGNSTQSAYKSMDQWQSDFSFSDHTTTATAASGMVTVSGSGSGSGSENGNRSSQYAMTDSSGDSLSGSVITGTYTYNGNWTQNYAQNTLNINSGILFTGTSWDSQSGVTQSFSDDTAAGWPLYEAPCTGVGRQIPQIGSTFNTAGSPGYGQVQSPGMTVTMGTLKAVPNYGTVVPSDPNENYTPPWWEKDAVWTCRGIAAVCSLGAAGLAVWGALGLGTMDVAVSLTRAAPYVHFEFGAAGVWLQAIGGTGSMWIFEGTGAGLQLTGIPVLSTAAVLASGPQAYNCFTAVIDAFIAGWGG